MQFTSCEDSCSSVSTCWLKPIIQVSWLSEFYSSFIVSILRLFLSVFSVHVILLSTFWHWTAYNVMMYHKETTHSLTEVSPLRFTFRASLLVKVHSTCMLVYENYQFVFCCMMVENISAVNRWLLKPAFCLVNIRTYAVVVQVGLRRRLFWSPQLRSGRFCCSIFTAHMPLLMAAITSTVSGRRP